MANVQQNLRRLGEDALGSAKKRRQISRCMKANGFLSLGKGAWLGFRSEDVVSGFLIEGSPLDTYISAFVLPAFDRLKFVSWSLGQRVVHCSIEGDTEVECDEAFAFYKKYLGSVRTSRDLLKYIDDRGVKGHYPIWVRYLCYLKELRLDEALKWLDDQKLARMHSVEIEKYGEINGYVVTGDTHGVCEILKGWMATSERIFGPFDQEFSAV
jgi:hypothetical protein